MLKFTTCESVGALPLGYFLQRLLLPSSCPFSRSSSHSSPHHFYIYIYLFLQKSLPTVLYVHSDFAESYKNYYEYCSIIPLITYCTPVLVYSLFLIHSFSTVTLRNGTTVHIPATLQYPWVQCSKNLHAVNQKPHYLQPLHLPAPV